MYGIQTRKGFITLTGEVGTGKTTLINRLLDWLHHRRARTAFLFNSRMNSNQLFDFILAEFDIRCDSKSKSQQLMKLNHWLLDRYRSGETVVLIIDEAQNLTYPVLEEIRLLTNLETSTEKLLQIVLSGQPEASGEKSNFRSCANSVSELCCVAGQARCPSQQTKEIRRGALRDRRCLSNPVSTPRRDAVHGYSLGIRVSSIFSASILW